MINPNDITKYDRTTEELQEFYLFSIFVAGKNSDVQAKKLDAMLFAKPERVLPFAWLATLPITITTKLVCPIDSILRHHKIGQYGRLSRTIEESLKLDLTSCTKDDLIGVHGVSHKTAEFFLIHSRQECADTDMVVLDTHIRSWLLNVGVDCPQGKDHPNGKLYEELRPVAIEAIKKHFPGLTLAEADLEIWKLERERKNARPNKP